MVNGQIVNIMMKKTYISPVTDMVILQSNIALMVGSITDIGGLGDDPGDFGGVGDPIDIGEGAIDADGREGDFFGDGFDDEL
jgi:hypothetical protein